MIETEVLKYGAIGIGLAILGYSATLLSGELARSKPRPEARNLILMYMAFSLVAFGGATYIELRKLDVNEENRDRLSKISDLVGKMDANLGGKYQATIDRVKDSGVRDSLNYFENYLCKEVREVKTLLHEDAGKSQCIISNNN